jgi:hypothetical protein
MVSSGFDPQGGVSRGELELTSDSSDIGCLLALIASLSDIRASSTIDRAPIFFAARLP